MKAFNKIKNNDKYIKFKRIWNNKRYSGLIKLGLWFLFFLVVAIIVRIPGQSQTTISYTTLQILEQTKSYGLKYEIKKFNFKNKRVLLGKFSRKTGGVRLYIEDFS